jgi:hypothetical protein
MTYTWSSDDQGPADAQQGVSSPKVRITVNTNVSMPGSPAGSLLNLPGNVIEAVLGYMSLPDILRFRATCVWAHECVPWSKWVDRLSRSVSLLDEDQPTLPDDDDMFLNTSHICYMMRYAKLLQKAHTHVFNVAEDMDAVLGPYGEEEDGGMVVSRSQSNQRPILRINSQICLLARSMPLTKGT